MYVGWLTDSDLVSLSINGKSRNPVDVQYTRLTVSLSCLQETATAWRRRLVPMKKWTCQGR